MDATPSSSTDPRRWEVIGAPIALIAVFLLTVILGRALWSGPATVGAASAANGPAAQQTAHTGQDVMPAQQDNGDMITLVTVGIASTVPNGSDVSVSGGLLATLTLSPGEDRYSRQLDVYLHDAQPSPRAIDGATVQATGRMRYMDHGTFRQMAVVAGDGHYFLPLTFPMPGEWEVELQLDGPRDHGKLTLNLDLFD